MSVMTLESEAKLQEIVRLALDLPADTDVTNARQLTVATWDSLAHVSLVLAIESEFGISIDVADQLRLTSYPAIRLYLEEHGT
jgi:acyl carrier protein